MTDFGFLIPVWFLWDIPTVREKQSFAGKGLLPDEIVLSLILCSSQWRACELSLRISVF